MAKFRTKTKGKDATINYMGGKAFIQSPKEELAFSVATTFIEGSYYESKDKRIDRITELIEALAKKDSLFVGKLAYIVRKEWHMRSAFHLLTALLAKYHKGTSLVKNLIVKGVERPDDLSEIVSVFGKPIPNQVKKGIREAFDKFDEYRLAKYKGRGKNFSLADLFNLVKPKPSKEKLALYKRLIEGKLKIPETWETKLSAGEEKKKVWKDLVLGNKIGYMALLRNLRNILKERDIETIKEACKQIADKEKVLKSKQLPFRFLSAFKALELKKETGLVFEKDTDIYNIVKDAIVKAVGYSVGNIPLLKGRTVILTDNSGSMRGDVGGGSLISRMSTVKTSDIGNLFAMLYWLRADNTLVGLFGDKLIIPKLDREKNVFENFNIVDEKAEQCGAGTETGIFTMFEELIKGKEKVDRIVIFSDMQVGEGCEWYDTGIRRGRDFNKLFQRYREFSPKTKVYSIDLKGYGNKLFYN